MPLSALPNVRFDNVVRVSPPLTKLPVINIAGTKHIVIGREGEKISNAIFLGKIREYTTGRALFNANVWLDVSRPKVILVFGRRGTGKSYDLGVIIEGLISTESKIRVGNYKFPVVVFDPLNQFWTLREKFNIEDEEEKRQLGLLKKWGLEPASFDNVKIFVPKGTQKRYPGAITFSLDISSMDADDWCGLFKVDKYVDPIGQLLSSAYTKVTESGYRVMNGFIKPKKDYDIADLIRCIEEDVEINDDRRGFSRQTRRAVLFRLRELGKMPIFSGLGVDVRSIFVPGQVSVFMLRELDESTRALIVGQIVKKILQARGIRWENEEIAKRLFQKAKELRTTKPEISKKLEEKARCLMKDAEEKGVPAGWVILDEAHTLCPSEGVSPAKEVLITYVKQGRAMGLSLAAATQQPSALSNKLISQRDIILVHHLGIKADVDAALSQMNPNFPEAIIKGRDKITANVQSFLINSLSRGVAILSSDEADRNFIIAVRPRVSPHGGKEPLFI